MSKRGLARLIIYHYGDKYGVLERARVPHTRQHLHQYIVPSLIRGAISAFIFFTYSRVEGSKAALSGYYFKTSVTSANQAHEINVAKCLNKAADKYISKTYGIKSSRISVWLNVRTE